jgi:CubicO group peptidase (beta-lactamase class C family)
LPAPTSPTNRSPYTGAQVYSSATDHGGFDSPPQLTEESPDKLTEVELIAFETYFQETMQKAGIPGAAVVLVQGDSVIYLNGFGLRELGKSDLVTPQTLFMLASASKPLTSLMMAALVDDGKLAWYTPAKDILPGFKAGNGELMAKLTFHHMICACSGWQGDRSDIFFRASVPAEEDVRSMADIPPVGEFEKVYIYSNHLVTAAGYLAGYAAGGSRDDLWQGYADAMQTRVFDPLGMAHTTLSIEAVQASGDYALLHGKTLDYIYQPMSLSVEHAKIPDAPAGEIWSSAGDMTKVLLLELDQGI